MRDVISCPGCGRKLRFSEDLAGALVACPSCGRAFTAPAENPRPGLPLSAPAPKADPERVTAPRRLPASPGGGRAAQYPAEEDEDAPFRFPAGPALPPCPPEEIPAWSRVRRGIGWMLVGVLAPPVGWLLLFVFCLLPGGQGPNPAAWGFYAIFILAHLVPEFAGQVDCTAVPRRGGARPLAVAGLLLYGLLVGLGLLHFSSLLEPYPPAPRYRPSRSPAPAQMLGLLVSLVGAVRFFVWLFFLRAVARLVAPRTLPRSLSTLLTLAGVTAGLLLFASVFLPAMRVRVRGTAFAALCSSCGVVVLVPLVAIWTVVVMFQVRSAVGSYLRGRGPA